MSPTCTRRQLVFTIGASSALLSASRAAAQEPFAIATSMPILQDIVANIAGDAAEVFSILPANADPHTWEATPQDMVRMAEAQAFISNGANLEPFVETGGWRGTLEDNDIPELEVADHVELISIDHEVEHGDHSHELGEGDPHIWLDPLTIVQAVPAIAAFLSELDPNHAETYADNAAAYVVELETLHADMEKSFAAIPSERRKLLVFHDAWRYFAARYDFTIIGIVLENPESEVSAQEMVDLLHVVEESGVNVIFAEPQFNTSVLDVLVAEGDIEIAYLLTDSFTDTVTTYIGLMEFNRDQLVFSLGD